MEQIINKTTYSQNVHKKNPTSLICFNITEKSKSYLNPIIMNSFFSQIREIQVFLLDI
jgi:hypothetical protein